MKAVCKSSLGSVISFKQSSVNFSPHPVGLIHNVSCSTNSVGIFIG